MWLSGIGSRYHLEQDNPLNQQEHDGQRFGEYPRDNTTADLTRNQNEDFATVGMFLPVAGVFEAPPRNNPPHQHTFCCSIGGR